MNMGYVSDLQRLQPGEHISYPVMDKRDANSLANIIRAAARKHTIHVKCLYGDDSLTVWRL